MTEQRLPLPRYVERTPARPVDADIGEGAALSEDEREALFDAAGIHPDYPATRHDLIVEVERILAARAGAADPLRQAVEALADEWDAKLHREFPGVDPAEYTDWHARDLRRVLDETDEV